MRYLNPFEWTAIGYANAMLTLIAVSLIVIAVKYATQ
jgi:hypothetical protein